MPEATRASARAPAGVHARALSQRAAGSACWFGLVALLVTGVTGCGIKPVPDTELVIDSPGTESEVDDDGFAAEGIGSSIAEEDSMSAATGLVADPSVDELLLAAEAALAAASDHHAAGEEELYRGSLDDGFAALWRAEAKLSEDPASFAFVRPAYEKLLGELREGLSGTAGETVEGLDASAEELAGAAELHPANGTTTYEMPVNPDDPLVAKYLALFQEGRRREYLEQAFRRSDRFREMVLVEIRAAGLPEELWVVPVVESGYKVTAYSRARAVGLWQFMATTARRYGLTVNEWVDERRDPVKSTRAALAYLEDLYLWFNNWDLALAAYNRGEGGIRRDINNSRIVDFMQMAELGVTHRETANHVPQIHAAAIIAKSPEKYGFRLGYEPSRVDTVVIDYVVDLEVVAECAGTSETRVKELNPEVRKWVTPVLSKDYPTYTLKLPEGAAAAYLAEIAKVTDKTPKRQIQYVVRRGDTLGAIGRKFGVSWRSIQRWNNLRSTRIRPGQKLVIMPKRGWPREVAVKKSTKRSTSAGSDGREIYTVRKGDSLYTIAQAFKTTISSLRKLNGLGRYSRIYPGQKLKVQEGGG
jgi:membrane-bound lytic murein transglycosylase D